MSLDPSSVPPHLSLPVERDEATAPHRGSDGPKRSRYRLRAHDRTSTARSSIQVIPLEIFCLVLCNLCGYELARARAVSRQWRDAINGVDSLRYIMELALEGVVEDGANFLSHLLKRAALERFKSFWNHLRLPGDSVRAVDACRGTIAVAGRWLIDYGDFSSTRVAYVQPDVDVFAWKTMPSLGLARAGIVLIDTVALRAVDMLVALSDASGDVSRLIPRIELLHAESFGPHPLVAYATLPWPASEVLLGDGDYSATVAICGDVLSVSFTNSSRTVTVVWNWRPGAVLFRFVQGIVSGDSLPHFGLLSTSAFCFVEYAWDPSGAIIVVLVVNTFDQDGVVRTRGRWEFPPLSNITVRLQVSVDAEITSDVRTRVDSHYVNHVPLPGAPSTDKLLAVVVVPPDGAVTFYVPISTFLLRPAASDRVPWEQWGPDNARCITGCVQSVHGCRALHRDGAELRALNFSPAKCRAARSEIFFDDRDVGTFCDEETTHVIPSCVPFRTRLPYFASRAGTHSTGLTLPMPLHCETWCDEGRVTWKCEGDARLYFVAL